MNDDNEKVDLVFWSFMFEINLKIEGICKLKKSEIEKEENGSWFG